jgi:hypothetical protein
MTPDMALAATYAKAQVRAEMWRSAVSAHERGDLRAVEVRASDFIGPNSQSLFTAPLVPPSAQGQELLRLR